MHVKQLQTYIVRITVDEDDEDVRSNHARIVPTMFDPLHPVSNPQYL